MERKSKNLKPKLISTSTQMISGANQLQLNEDDASRLIGNIVEKGIQENRQTPTQAPKLTVLPFPIARHRSHGPHWDPINSQKGGNYNDEDEEDDKEHQDFTGFDPFSEFANPVQRRQKKGLDVSRWRELIQKDDSLETDKAEENKLCLKKTAKHRNNNVDQKKVSFEPCRPNEAPMELDVEPDLSSSRPQNIVIEATPSDMDTGSFISAINMELDDSRQQEVQEKGRNITSVLGSEAGLSEKVQPEKMEIDPRLTEMLKKTEQRTSATSTFINSGNEQRSMPLECEIDAENRARLQSMSTEEIAEAQAEIIQKLDPALINLLKMRGKQKMKKQNPLKSSEAVNGQLANNLSESILVKDSNVSPYAEGDSSDTIETTASKDAQIGPGNSVIQNTYQGRKSLWNTWSKRVEAVRGLRFLFDGSIIVDESETAIESGHAVDNVAERDFLRTEGDPGAAGYTIKEAVQLTRSVIPGQRALAFHLLASVLDAAIHNIQQNRVGCIMQSADDTGKPIDWEAIWAYALGPEPELALSLRIGLDDNHNSVVLACAKVIQCALTCDLNEKFFEISEKIATSGKNIFTAPVFRSKPDVDAGFLAGGFWKYSAKPSNILTCSEDISDDATEGKHTIQDDIVIAGQDFAAGLIRMGILLRLRYLLEANPTAALEECIISILIAFARHSPTCAHALMNCQGLVTTIVHRFTMGNNKEITHSKIKSVNLLKVLAQCDKKYCMEFITKGIFQEITCNLYQCTSLGQWVAAGKESCILSSALMVEQLQFWKVCIRYGCCISYFTGIFSNLCLWMSRPTFEKLKENNVLVEFASISREAYLVLEALTEKLPSFFSQQHSSTQIADCSGDEQETWSWNYVIPMVDLALNLLGSKSDSYISRLFEWQKGIRSDLLSQDLSPSSMLWVYSAIMQMLSTLLERVKPEDTICLKGSGKHVPWLPEFVPKIGLEIIKSGFLSFSEANGVEREKDLAVGGSFIEKLCHFRQHGDCNIALASVCCLRGLMRVVTSIDELIDLAKSGIHSPPSEGYNTSKEGKILEDGILKRSLVELRFLINVFMNLVASEWHFEQSVELFGRGGPAPGVGVGWGNSGGGLWSMTVLLAQTDAVLLIHMLEIFLMVSNTELRADMAFTTQWINCVLGVCLTIGLQDRVIVEKALHILLQVPVLKYLDSCIQQFVKLNKKVELFEWEHGKVDYLLFSKILASHFYNRWLSRKRKLKSTGNDNVSVKRTSLNSGVSLPTIHEDLVTSNMISQDYHNISLATEWAYQRLPLPKHWFLSPISTINNNKHADPQSSDVVPSLRQEHDDILQVAKGGLFFLLGMEAMSTLLSPDSPSVVRSVPLIWKFHSLSVILLVGMGVLEDERSRNIYEVLQGYYGQLLDDARSTNKSVAIVAENAISMPETGKKFNLEFLRFQSEIHESYSTFLETLVEQFAAVSYGDVTFGRQVALYLHRCTEASVRLAAWNALANARVLEILPPLDKCYADAEGYLEPNEDDEGMLEAYVKSWVSGALDRAATRGSMAFVLAVHHLSSFIFLSPTTYKLSLRNRLVKSLLRDYSQKEKHEGMLLDLVGYCKPSASYSLMDHESLSPQSADMEKRFKVLAEACDGNSSLLVVVEKLKSAFLQKQFTRN